MLIMKYKYLIMNDYEIVIAHIRPLGHACRPGLLGPGRQGACRFWGMIWNLSVGETPPWAP